jgi:hypothetical protein
MLFTDVIRFGDPTWVSDVTVGDVDLPEHAVDYVTLLDQHKAP